MTKPTTKPRTLAVVFDGPTVERIEKLAEQMRRERPGARVTNSDALRHVVSSAFDHGVVNESLVANPPAPGDGRVTDR